MCFSYTTFFLSLLRVRKLSCMISVSGCYTIPVSLSRSFSTSLAFSLNHTLYVFYHPRLRVRERGCWVSSRTSASGCSTTRGQYPPSLHLTLVRLTHGVQWGCTLYRPPSPSCVFCPKMSRRPLWTIKLLDVSLHFVADAPMKKISTFRYSPSQEIVWTPVYVFLNFSVTNYFVTGSILV